MSILDRILRSSRQSDVSSYPAPTQAGQVQVHLPEPETNAPIRGIIDRGKCEPDAGCTPRVPVISPSQMRDLIRSLPQLKERRVVNAVFDGGGHELGPKRFAFAVALLSRQSEARIGLLHWRRGRHIFLRVQAIESLAGITEWSYGAVVRAMERSGWEARDMDFSLERCEPFRGAEPQITETEAVNNFETLHL